MSKLAERDCEPSPPDANPLGAEQIRPLLGQIDEDWQAVDDQLLRREFRFENFAEALAFTNRVGEMADAQDHHPDIHLAWGKAAIEIWTHTVNGLREADFVFAAKCDALYPRT
ncbi:MAG: 4a-hydroxytetrahydrobiopterin dehydratase [bacterium]|nr:4a-hydroxytetrahydrobiopterin dehydratase [bacterium]